VDSGSTPLEQPPTHDRRHPKHAEDSTAIESHVNKFKQNYPFNRKAIPSLLSSESPFHNYRGFLHLAGLILLVAIFRLVVENLLKYGILLKPETLASYMRLDILIWLLVIPVVCVAMLIVQRMAAATPKPAISGTTSFVVSVILLAALVLVPMTVVLLSPASPASGLALMMISCITWLKMVSYGMTNRQYRRDKASGVETKEHVSGVDAKDAVHYPQNLTLSNLAYFLAAPTLCYQLNYPRSPKIRWGYVLNKVAQLVFFVCAVVFMMEQWCFPVVKNSFVSMKEGKYGHLVERVMKLSVPSLAIWLSIFYAFFHLWLNIVAEILKFGDREFYRDWWNATSMNYYWRTWNIPTHNWLVRHVYMPALRHGCSKSMAAALVFLFSAVFHELIISVALQTFKLYFFIGMIVQIPATLTGMYFKGTVAGNLIFWLSFCFLGQPIGVLLYYFDFASHSLEAAEAATAAAAAAAVLTGP
jgi:diacylglycerol O-acyltransferase-1